MLYIEYINKVMEETIEQADNGLSYLNPMWETIIEDCQLSCSDKEVSMDKVEDILKLEVQKRNTIVSNKPYVDDWFYDLITTTVEPTMLSEETEYVKQLVEYMKAKNELNKGDTDGDENLDNIVPFPGKED